jgi:DNA-directed RNA polymerase specialized sigma24 family protein
MPPATAATEPEPTRSELLADPELYRVLSRFVQGRVPGPDAEDVVQATMADALGAADAPTSPDQLRRWVIGIARHKVADFYRRAKREMPSEVLDEVPADSAPHSARDLLRWVESELPEGGESPKTLEWMMREAGGDKLETIAAEERMPAPRVRQRVSRLRRHLRSRWLTQVGVAAAVVTAALVLYWRLRTPGTPEIVRETPLPPHSAKLPDERELRVERGRSLRREALARCAEHVWQPCLNGLDQAAELDPAGDTAEEVGAARREAADALVPTPVPPTSARQPTPAPPNTAFLPKPAPESTNDSPIRQAPKKASSKSTDIDLDQGKAKGEEGKLGNPVPQKAGPSKSDSKDSKK